MSKNNNKGKIDLKKIFKDKKVRIIAIGTAIALVAGGFALQKSKEKRMVPNPTPITDLDQNQQQKKLSPSLAFDPNDNREMIDRIANIYVDALSKGINNVEIDQWMDFYTVLNLNNIDVKDFARLEAYDKTKDSMIRNFDYVANVLLDDAITSEPSTIVDIQSLIADKASASAVKELQTRIAAFNISSNKKEDASAINEYIENEFGTANYRQVDSASNLVRMKLLLAMERVTINNNSYRIPTKDMSKMIFGDSSLCDTPTDKMINTVYNGEKTVVKQMLEEKLSYVMNQTVDKTGVSAEEMLTAMEIEIAINDILKERNLQYVPNPSAKDVIMDNLPKTSDKSTVKSTDKIVKDPKTGKDVIVIPQTEAEKKAQQQEIQKQIDKENETENQRANGVQDGAQAGWNDGYADGYKGAKKNNNIGEVSGDKTYAAAFKDAYKKQYDIGYEEGQKKREREGNKETTTKPSDSLLISGYNEGSRVGYEKGYDDGFYNRGYNDSCTVNHESSIYREGYKSGYAEQYKIAYEKGRIARLSMTEKDWKNLGEKEGATAGFNQGRYDGLNGRTYDATCLITGEKAYVDAYKSAYYQNYSKGYTEGQNKAKIEKEDAQRKKGKEDGAKAGQQKGYDDGYYDRTYNTYTSVSGDKAYVDAYVLAYAESYRDSYLKGKADRELEKSRKEEETLYIKGFQAGKDAGYSDGYKDGKNSAKYNDSKAVINYNEKAYRSGYEDAYRLYYEQGYSVGQNEKLNKSTPSQPVQTPKEEKKETKIINESFDLDPNFEITDDGKIIDKRTGLEVKLTSSTQQIEELKLVKAIANALQQTIENKDKVHRI